MTWGRATKTLTSELAHVGIVRLLDSYPRETERETSDEYIPQSAASVLLTPFFSIMIRSIIMKFTFHNFSFIFMTISPTTKEVYLWLSCYGY